MFTSRINSTHCLFNLMGLLVHLDHLDKNHSSLVVPSGPDLVPGGPGLFYNMVPRGPDLVQDNPDLT